MSYRTLDIASGQNGGAIQLAQDPKRPRNIHVCILNPTANTYPVQFGRSRRELTTPGAVGLPGFVIIALPNTVANSSFFGVAYTQYLFQGWTGELWAAAGVSGLIQIDVFDAVGPEK